MAIGSPLSVYGAGQGRGRLVLPLSQGSSGQVSQILPESIQQIFHHSCSLIGGVFIARRKDIFTHPTLGDLRIFLDLRHLRHEFFFAVFLQFQEHRHVDFTDIAQPDLGLDAGEFLDYLLKLNPPVKAILFKQRLCVGKFKAGDFLMVRSPLLYQSRLRHVKCCRNPFERRAGGAHQNKSVLQFLRVCHK